MLAPGISVHFSGTSFAISQPDCYFCQRQPLNRPTATAPQLTITPFVANVVLTWPTNVSGFTLQSTTNLVSPAVWTNVSPGPVVVNGQNVIINPLTGQQEF